MPTPIQKKQKLIVGVVYSTPAGISIESEKKKVRRIKIYA